MNFILTHLHEHTYSTSFRLATLFHFAFTVGEGRVLYVNIDKSTHFDDELIIYHFSQMIMLR